MGRHDACYRRLLHNPQLVRSLFEGILDLRMPGVLDWSRLEPLLPPGLEPYRLQARYLLVDEGALVRAGGLPENNLAALLFRLEHNRGIEETQQLVQTIIALTQDDVYTELRLALGEWLRHVLLPRALPEVDLIHAPVTLTEITDMMTEHSRSWTHQWRQEGRLEGKAEGKMEGYAVLLATQITRKFGGLPVWAQTRLEHADEATLNRWALQILDAQRIEDVFG